MRADDLCFATVVNEDRDIARVGASLASSWADHGATFADTRATAALGIVDLAIGVIVHAIADFWPNVLATSHRIADVQGVGVVVCAVGRVARQAVGTIAGIANSADVAVVTGAGGRRDEAFTCLWNAGDGLTGTQPFIAARNDAGWIKDTLRLTAVLVAEPAAVTEVAVVVTGAVCVFQARADR